ncbi:MAG: LysM peptidoglycan-binding domain-containing protein [Rhizobiaceae bacterium]|nr:LysM peptidoglycan-binding domain-containing protein [Rhizobiaceae bacterium]
MKRLQKLSAALSVSCGVGVLMAVIVTGNKSTLPRTAVVIPTENPAFVQKQTLARAPATTQSRLPQRRTAERTRDNGDGIDRIITSSISRPKPASNINDIISQNSGDINPYPGSKETVIVRSKDTLAAIARRTGISIYQLAAINSIEAPYIIRPGQILRLGE